MQAFLILCILMFLSTTLSAESSSLNFLNRILNINNEELQKSTERLAEGRYLLTDNPANYAIYDKMAAVIRGMDATIRNTDDMISLYKVEDSALGGSTELLQQIRILVLQKDSGILADDDRMIMDSQIAQLTDQILFVFNNAEFNTVKILSEFLTDSSVLQSLQDPARYTLLSIDAMLRFIGQQRTVFGARMNTLKYAMAGDAIAKENTQAMQSHGDTDFASESVRLKRSQILIMANLLMLKTQAPH